jgi:hypothetical protein
MTDEHADSPREAGADDGGREEVAARAAERVISRVSPWIQALETDMTHLRGMVTGGGGASRGANGAQQSLDGQGPGGGQAGGGGQPPEGEKQTPVPEWCWFPPPPEPDDGDPRARLAGFVDWFNTVYVGRGGAGQAGRIPACWRDHPGLVAEIATLAATWREAFLNPEGLARDGQYWHHTWLPGFTARMQRTWLTDVCLRDDHSPGQPPPRKDVGASPRADRWTEADSTVTNDGGGETAAAWAAEDTTGEEGSEPA